MTNRINLPYALPQQKLCSKMAHAEYIANALAKDIKAYCSQSFDTFGIDIRVYPLPSAHEFHDRAGRWVGLSKYVFDAFGREPKAMRVTVDHRGDVKVGYLGAWRPVSAYLQNLEPMHPWDDSMSRSDIMHLQWRHQADWWKENGKVFPLLDLPAEIREMIFEEVWGTHVEPYPVSKTRRLTPLGKIARKLRMPNANLLRANVQIASEAGNILYMRTPFVIEHYGILKAFTMNAEQRSLVRHLELAFSHDEFMHLFSTDHVRHDRKAKTQEVGFGYPALALRTMKLNTLRLVIAPPSLTTSKGRFDGACQRVVIDMLMEAAWPVIRGHPLELIGHIKDSQKAIYEARDGLERKRVQAWRLRRKAWGVEEEGTLAEYDEERDEEVGGVPVDGSMPEIKPEEGPPREHDLVCYCDPPCEEATWTP